MSILIINKVNNNLYKELLSEFLLIVERERERERVSLLNGSNVRANDCKAHGFNVIKFNNEIIIES